VTQPDQRLAGRTGLITGAASGIGAAGADLFAAHGAALVLLDSDRAGGQRVADAITARGGRAVFQAGDAASPDDVAGAVRAAVRLGGRLDLLWANAGIGVARTVPDTALEEWDRVLAVNLTGAFLLAKYGVPVVKLDSAQDRNRAARATSAGPATRPSGCAARSSSWAWASVRPPAWPASQSSCIGVVTDPGHTMFTRMPSAAWSSARALQSMRSPPLVAQ